YIYHNRIDDQGDKIKTEQNTCESVEKTIEELSKFIKKLHSSYFVNRVIITADHGFLYTYELPQEKDLEKVEMESLLAKDSRFLLAKPGEHEALGYAIPLSRVSPFNEKLEIIIPEGINRYRVPGAGKRYVHGGASLQELVVPVIESIRRRKEVSRKVDIMVPARNLRIVSNVLRLKVFQNSPVSATEKEIQIRAGIFRNNELVSDEKEMLMNSVSQNPSERMHDIILNLRPGLETTGILYLRIYDVEDSLNPLYEMKVVNESSISSDF
ncbi:MAG: PglZ domain-containing protein, partial [Bacteroidales bacterium]|nr:PglZ domain-containing protein [Bacteroidales bacterium]